jgi:hypothetical protein
MAEVFKCRLDGIGGFDKTVVLKCILQQHLGNQEFVQMFLDEARVAAPEPSEHRPIFEIGEVESVLHRHGIRARAQPCHGELRPGSKADHAGRRAAHRGRLPASTTPTTPGTPRDARSRARDVSHLTS